MTTLLKAQPRVIDVSTYASLRDRVKETLLEGQRKIEEQKVLTYWHTGKHIAEHLRLNGDTTEYGKQVLEDLSEDVELHVSVLRKITQFYRAFCSAAGRRALRLSLTWSHYRALIHVPDEEKRWEYARLAKQKEWSSEKLETEIRNYNWTKRIAEEEGKTVQLPPVILGPFHTYQIIRPETISDEKRELVLDCGFSFKKELDFISGGKRFTEGMIVISVKNELGYSLEIVKPAPKQTPEDLLYTYKAYVLEVIDGDTLKLDFRVGFGDRRGETIRLNLIDCPELDTPEGRAAKRFVESQLAPCKFITVKSIRTRKEKWGRYLGDVFFQKKGIEAPVYLNQLLLDKGHAVKVRN